MSPDPDPFIVAASLEGVPAAFSASRDGIDALLRDRGLRRTTPEDTARSLLLGAAANARLEGDDVDADALTAGEGNPTSQAALRLSGQLLGTVPAWRRAPLQVIARLHSVAASGSAPDDELGRPSNPEGTARLAELGKALVTPTTAPGLVVAALAHAEIIAAGAFDSHNGIVARAVERIVMVSTGVDPASVTVPEAAHAEAPKAYRHMVHEYATGGPDGVHQWLLYAAEVYTRAAELSPVARR